jgi:hypothetical protein
VRAALVKATKNAKVRVALFDTCNDSDAVVRRNAAEVLARCIIDPEVRTTDRYKRWKAGSRERSGGSMVRRSRKFRMWFS